MTVTASPSGSISTAQALSVAVAVASSAGAPAGSVILSSGNYASFPVYGKWRTGGGQRAGGAVGGGSGYLDGEFHAREYGFVHERVGHRECDGGGFRSG